MKPGKVVALVILIAAIAVMGYAGFKVYEANKVYEEGNAAYEDLRGAAAVAEEPAGPVRLIDFDELARINSDIVAWLYGPDTMIDYPVLKAKDYNQYLRHLPDGTYNMSGSLFIDYNNSYDFSDPLTIIYGHHMKTGAMFGSLVGYKEPGYYEEHPYVYLYTRDANYRIDLVYGCVIAANQWRKQGFMFASNLSELVEFAAENTTFSSVTEYDPEERVVVMSTCSYEFDDARYIVLGILTEMDTAKCD